METYSIRETAESAHAVARDAAVLLHLVVCLATGGSCLPSGAGLDQWFCQVQAQ
jgi:hypothetical protein